MSYQPFYRSESIDYPFLENENLQEKRIDLSSDQIRWAAQLSEPVYNIQRRWQVYLNALALTGFKQWLSEWADDLTIDDANCSILRPQYINLLEVVCNLQVESFTLCLIAVDSHIDTSIDVPKAVVELPQFTPHFYVLVQISEEQGQAQIQGYLRHDQLLRRQAAQPPSAETDWTYELPLKWFTLDSAALLLELRYLEAAAIPLTVTSPSITPIHQLETKLAEVQAQLRSSRQFPEQFLTWQEGASLLTNPALISAYLLNPAAPSPTVQQVINAGLWLHNRLDALAQDLAWSLMPRSAQFAPAFRSPMLRSSLADQGVKIPPEARVAYQDLDWEGAGLRLYAAVWNLPTIDRSLEWVLLLVLGAQPGYRLSPDIKFQIRDATDLLGEQISMGSPGDESLCIQVAGTWDEQFWTTIALANGSAITLPPFAFNPAGLP